jgi:hypothetical protein
MPRAPHALNMERAEEFNELVLGWLRSGGARTPVDGTGDQDVAAERTA